MINNLVSVIRENFPSDGRSVRLFHGRGKKFHGLEHISIDYYSPTVLITLFKETSPEVMTSIPEALNSVTCENILIQKRYLPRPTLEAVKGEIPTSSIAVEDSLKFNLKFGETQNIGFFLDMYPGRKLLERISLDKKVLNLFSYTCSLSVCAMKGGAKEVTNVDMSRAALIVGESNHRLNGLTQGARFLAYDIINSWKKIFNHAPYDIVVIDPPTNQGDSFRVERDYYKIIKRLNDMTSKDSVIMACLNSPHHTSQFLMELFKEHAPEFKFQEIIYSAFSSMEANPEEGLKIAIFKKI